MPAVPQQSKAGFASEQGVLVDQAGTVTVNFNTRTANGDWTFVDNVLVSGWTSLGRTDVAYNHATLAALTVTQAGAAPAIKSVGPLVGTSYFMPNTLDTLSGGAGFREKSSAPGMWFEELGTAKGALFVLYGGIFTLQRRATDFGGWEANVLSVDLSAPSQSFEIDSAGIVRIGKYLLANVSGSIEGGYREKGGAPGFWLEQAGTGLGAFLVLNSDVVQIQRRATSWGAFQAQVCRFELATLDAYFGRYTHATRYYVGTNGNIFSEASTDTATDVRVSFRPAASTTIAGLRFATNNTGYATIDATTFNAGGTAVTAKILRLNATGGAVTVGTDPGGSETFRVNGSISTTAITLGGVSLATTLAGKEPALGNPASDGYVLASTAAGVRSWVAPGVANLDPRGATNTRLISTGITADASFRLGLYSDGTIGWADGAAAVDTNLYRSAAGALQTDGTFTAKSTVSVCGLRLSTATASGVGNYLGIAYLSADALVHAETRAVRNGSYSGQTVYEFWLKNGEAGLVKRAWIDSYGYFYSTDGVYSMVMGGAVVGTTNAAPFSLVTGNTTRLTIAADGSTANFNAATSVIVGADPGGTQKLRVGGDAIINGQIELPSNSAAAVNSLYLHNASGASYATLSVCGTTAYGLPRWVKATVLESIGVGDGDGSLVLSSYFGDFIVETSGRSLTLRYDRAGTLSWVTNGTSGSKLFAATGAGGQTLYGYSDGGGVGITRSTSFSTSSLVYLTGTNIDLYSGAERIAQVISTGFVVGGDPGNNGSYLRSGKGAWIRNNAGANEQVALIDGSAGGQVVFFDAADTMPGGVITDRIIQRWIANGTGGYAYGTIWDVCLGHSSSPVGNGTDRLNNRLVFRARTNADSLASYTDSMVLTGAGGLTVGTADLFLGGSCLQLLSGSVDHCYMGFYPRTATPGTRGAYFGFPGVGTTQLSLVNEIGGGINSYFAGAGHVFGDSVSGDPGGSETIRTSGAARLGSVISARLYAAATNNLHLDAGIGSGAVYLNYYHGTGGVHFCNGAGSVMASVTSGGYATFLGVASTSTSPAVGATQFIAQGYQGGYGAGMSAYSQLAVSGVNTEMGRLVFDGEAAWSSADLATQRAYFSLKLNYQGVIYAPVLVNSTGKITATLIQAPTRDSGLYYNGNMTLTAANSSSVAALGFHIPGVSGCAIYHAGDGAGLLRLMRWAGGDYRIYHSGTDDVIHRLNEGSGYYQAPDWVEFTQAGQGVYWSHGAGAAIYKASNNYLYVRTSGAVAYVDQSDTIRGYVYHDAGSGNFGLLNAAGVWSVRVSANVVTLDQGVLQVGGITNPYFQLNSNTGSGDVAKSYVQWNNGNAQTDYWTAGSHRLLGAVFITGALSMADDIVFASGANLYYGDRGTDGTVRIAIVGAALVVQRRSGGTYSTIATLATW